ENTGNAWGHVLQCQMTADDQRSPTACHSGIARVAPSGARSTLQNVWLCPHQLPSALVGAFPTRTTAASLARCARARSALANKSPFARAVPTMHASVAACSFCLLLSSPY